MWSRRDRESLSGVGIRTPWSGVDPCPPNMKFSFFSCPPGPKLFSRFSGCSGSWHLLFGWVTHVVVGLHDLTNGVTPVQLQPPCSFVLLSELR